MDVNGMKDHLNRACPAVPVQCDACAMCFPRSLTDYHRQTCPFKGARQAISRATHIPPRDIQRLFYNDGPCGASAGVTSANKAGSWLLLNDPTGESIYGQVTTDCKRMNIVPEIIRAVVNDYLNEDMRIGKPIPVGDPELGYMRPRIPPPPLPVGATTFAAVPRSLIPQQPDHPPPNTGPVFLAQTPKAHHVPRQPSGPPPAAMLAAAQAEQSNQSGATRRDADPAWHGSGRGAPVPRTSQYDSSWHQGGGKSGHQRGRDPTPRAPSRGSTSGWHSSSSQYRGQGWHRQASHSRGRSWDRHDASQDQWTPQRHGVQYGDDRQHPYHHGGRGGKGWSQSKGGSTSYNSQWRGQ